MACAWLAEAFGDPPKIPPALAGEVGETRWDGVARMVRAGISSPLTTSVGRLFDAVAALCGLRASSTYEGQAAAELEAAAAPLESIRESGAYPMPLIAEGEAPVILDARETIRAIVADLASGAAPDAVSARFHLSLAGATASACALLAERHGTSTVALGGGAFQNRLLIERVAALLAAAGIRVLLPARLPPNDGAISYGQAAVAAATDALG
jgi:hydrogenase maturation protein HypF